MKNITYLYEKINTQKEALKNFNPEIFEIPKYISENLKYNFFKWQKEAIENFLFYENPKSNLKKYPTHLMFNMATGTGKTLLMASMILYFYKQGYRHFLFFVNQNNIIDKTENNFIDSTHTKYLFRDKIVIDDKTIQIKKVENFSDNPQGIEIKFTSIQKLYNDIHLQKENKTTLEDLHKLNIVMLADEAHHLNAKTKNKKLEQKALIKTEIKNKEEIEKLGWEHTIIELILNKNGKKKNNKNVLLEFTATIPETEAVAKKYEDKIIYKFTLKEFLRAGYTKEINLISSTLDKKERILQALLFQWYRHKIALKHNIPNFKPVILFRSKTIEESKQDYEEFLKWVDKISSSDFEFLKTIDDKIHQTQKETLFEMGKSRTEQLLKFLKNEKISFSEIAEWIKNNYQERNTIITNSKTNKTKKEKTDEETEKLLNSLEDKNNHIRAIFTVDRLTEGWDVLNLFDIVRLYQGQNSGGQSKKTPEATIKEKQLIGRGVRYYPFDYKDKIRNKRKFDDDLNNELRILEELFYYTYDEDSRYISHLKAELRKDGYIPDDDKVVTEFSLKESFKNSEFYKNVKVWYNKQIDNPNRQKRSLDEVKKEFSFTYQIKGLKFREEEVEFDEKKSENLNLDEKNFYTIRKKFKEIEKNIFYKAINIKSKQENSLFRFENLQKELQIKSIDDLRKDEFLGDFEIKIINKNKNYDDIENNKKLEMVMKFLDKFSNEMKKYIIPKIGSKFIAGSFDKFFSEPKRKSVDEKKLDKTIPQNEWYVLDKFIGTSEEKAIIEFIKESFQNLKEKYEEIYLLRNEEVYKIYSFKDGRGFQPDFLLFLKGKENIYYQIFIEPKGDNLLEFDKWKEKFLEEISQKYGMNNILTNENRNYKLIGLPFFNKNDNFNFENEFKKII